MINLLALISASALSCVVVSQNGATHSFDLVIQKTEDGSSQFVFGQGASGAFPNADLSAPATASTRGAYSQFELRSATRRYMLAFHEPYRSRNAALIHASVIDSEDQLANWYWASGFCQYSTEAAS